MRHGRCRPWCASSKRTCRTTPGSASTCSTATSWCSARSSASRRRTRASRSAAASAAPPPPRRRRSSCDDVNADPRYLACSIETQSEIVVPIMHGGDVLGEIDIDSDSRPRSAPTIATLLEAVAALLAPQARTEHDHEPHVITLIPGDGIGPEVTAGGRPHLQGGRRSTSSGSVTTPASSPFKRYGQTLPARCSTRSSATRSR